jgi:hypothetical protein
MASSIKDWFDKPIFTHFKFNFFKNEIFNNIEIKTKELMIINHSWI